MPSTVVDTRLLPQAHRDARWTQATADFLVPLEISSAGAPITGRIAGEHRGEVSLCHLLASPHDGIRTARLARGRGSECYKIAIATHGTVTVRQHGRAARLRPGDWTVYDVGDEYAVGSVRPFGLFIALVPHSMLGDRALIAARAAVAFDEPVVATELLDAVRTGASLSPSFDAIAGLMRAPGHRFRRGAVSSDAIFREATRLIDSHLAEASLGPDYLSAALGISRRRLYGVFEARVGPVARFIRSRRMVMAHSLLADPANAGTTIGEIAASVGIVDPAHFRALHNSGCKPGPEPTGLQ